MRLIPMSDFVLEQKLMLNIQGYEKKFISNVSNYAKFLKRPLELGMFVPIDESGNVMEEPVETIGGVELYSEKYQKAKEKVLFEGFEIRDKGNFYFIEQKKSCLYYRVLKNNSKATIEKLLPFNEAILTESAIKQLGL